MKTALMLLILWLVVCGNTFAIASEDSSSWLDSYGHFKTRIRESVRDNKQKCEKLLYGILKAIDDNSYCSESVECSLISHDPFGYTIPIRSEYSSLVLNQMKEFKEKCHDNKYQYWHNKDSIHQPICWENRCMVKTQTKDNN